MHASTHVLFSIDDLSLLERRLGTHHPICARIRSALAECSDPILNGYRQAALCRARSGELEIDPGAVVSKGDDAGAYVMAWLWISDGEIGP